MRKWATTFAIITLVAMLASTAGAQYESSDKSLLGIRLGFFKPSGSELSDIRDVWMYPCIDFNLKHDQYDRPTLIASIGWMGEDTNNDLTEGRIVPITATFLKRTEKSSGKYIYYGGGLGYYSIRYRDYYGRTISSSGNQLGFHVLGGYEFGGGWFAELRYDKIGDLSLSSGSNASFDGITLSLGSRFGY